MLNLRDYYNKLMKLPKPNRRETEVLIKLIYLQGREDEKLYQNRNIRRTNALERSKDSKV